MNLSKVERIQLDMSQDETYSLWCLLDEVHDANEISLPASLVDLVGQLRKLMEERRSPAQQSLNDQVDMSIRPDPREIFDAARKRVGVEPNPGNMSGDPSDMER